MVDSAEDRDVGDSQGDEEEDMTGVEEDEVISDVKEDVIMAGFSVAMAEKHSVD
ncbi:hypothetical protein ABVK25_003926 [Lepraria finkii]|uniref:Uncharacterized protein n=1 Tax=Lepraria finkii TaxID=1340010 RepID=A0ABR4BE39_9LECA